MRIKLQMIMSMAGLTLFCGIMSLGDESEEKLALAVSQHVFTRVADIQC